MVVAIPGTTRFLEKTNLREQMVVLCVDFIYQLC